RLPCMATIPTLRAFCFFAGCFTLLAAVLAADRPTKPLTADDVRALQKAYQAERAVLEKSAAQSKFPSDSFQKADELARASETLLSSNQLLEARDKLREARWVLPAVPIDLPSHVARIMGSPKLRQTSGVNALVYNADGTRLATASNDGN